MDSIDRITEIPVEVLGEIFSYCSADCPDAPLVIRAVCRVFHHVTEVTPQLWTNVKISGKDDVTAARKATLWLAKSGACTTTLSVAMDDSEGRDSYAQLSTTLAQHRSRIASLTVHAPTENQVGSFLSSIYTSPGTSLNISSIRNTLQLTIRVDSDYTTLDAQPLFPVLSTPHLSSINLATPTVPNLSTINFAFLQSLRITRPIRSTPIPTKTILDVLSASPCLVGFHLETRFDLSAEESPQSSLPLHLPVNPRQELITLLKLTSLSLRTNNNPALLNVLVLPELYTLHLNALDGRRRGRAEETASALRLLLIRMDDPSVMLSNPSTDRGIEELELSGVAITRPSSAIARNELWEWCFRRMRALRRITARNMDTEHLVELLSQGMGRLSVPSYMGLGQGTEGVVETGDRTDDAVCPRLEYLGVPLPDASIAMKRFRIARPFVKIRALGYGFGNGEGTMRSSEDALRARKVKADAMVEGKEMYGTAKDLMRSKEAAGNVIPRAVPLEPDEVVKAVEPTTPTAPTPRVIVGGFGFGSQFARSASKVDSFYTARSPEGRRDRRFHGLDELF